MADRSWGSQLGYKKDQDHQLLLMHWSHRSSHMWERCLCIRNKWYTFIHRTKCGNHKNRHQNPQMNENSHMGKDVLKGASLITKPKTNYSLVEVMPCVPFGRWFQMVFQKYSLFPHMTIAENIAFGLKISKHPQAYIDDKIKYALKLVNWDG